MAVIRKKKRFIWRTITLLLTSAGVMVYLNMILHNQLVVSGTGGNNRNNPELDQGKQRLCSQDDRLQTLRSACRRRNKLLSGAESEPRNHLLVDDRHKLIFCDIAKSGSTAWLSLLIQASGSAPASLNGKVVQATNFLSKFNLKRLRSYNATEIQHRVDSYFKFLVVRHPFECLVSGYRDKVLIHYGQLKTKILDLYSGKHSNTSVPTFNDFARFITDKHDNDDHWINYNDWCQPCQIKWDAVLKLESTEHDSHIIIKRLGDDINVTSLPVRHSHQNTTSLNQIDKSLKQFDRIKPAVLRRLYEIYGFDMEMFGYSWNQTTLTASCQSSTTQGSCC